jgi:mannose-6-phosphate isomerase-like protein (cupin superfamily)
MDPIHVAASGAERLAIFGVDFAVTVPAASTGGAFSLFEEVTPPGFGPPLHIHHAEEEFFRVTAGRYRFRVGDRDLDAGPGDTLVVPRGTPHTFLNVGDEPGHLFMGFSPGGGEAFFTRVAAEKLAAPDDMPRIAALGAEHNLEFLGPNPLI